MFEKNGPELLIKKESPTQQVCRSPFTPNVKGLGGVWVHLCLTDLQWSLVGSQ